MKKILLTLFSFSALTFSSYTESFENDNKSNSKYNSIPEISEIILSTNPEESPREEVLNLFFEGFFKLKDSLQMNNEKTVAIIDFSLPSTEKRLWIYDLESKELLKKTYVAHGKNTGDLFAEKFSNTVSSLQSSLGFYLTGNTYQGKHGLSLYLNGLEPGINNKAKERAIVMHGADYVSESFIQNTGRLGRSFGCPSVANDEAPEIINLLADGACLFIFHPSENYLKQSKLINIKN